MWDLAKSIYFEVVVGGIKDVGRAWTRRVMDHEGRFLMAENDDYLC